VQKKREAAIEKDGWLADISAFMKDRNIGGGGTPPPPTRPTSPSRLFAGGGQFARNAKAKEFAAGRSTILSFTGKRSCREEGSDRMPNNFDEMGCRPEKLTIPAHGI